MALEQMIATVSAPTLSFSARSMRVYLGSEDEPVNIVHMMSVTMKRL
jgi:hypothetical protein